MGLFLYLPHDVTCICSHLSSFQLTDVEGNGDRSSVDGPSVGKMVVNGPAWTTTKMTQQVKNKDLPERSFRDDVHIQSISQSDLRDLEDDVVENSIS